MRQTYHPKKAAVTGRLPNASEALPSDLAAAHAMILAERAARLEAEAAAARERAASRSTDALIGRLKLEIEKLRRDLYGTRSHATLDLLGHFNR